MAYLKKKHILLEIYFTENILEETQYSEKI